MNKEFFDALDLLEREKGIPKEYMLEKVEAALISAFKRELGGSMNVRVVLDPKKKDMKVFQQLTVVETVESRETALRGRTVGSPPSGVSVTLSSSNALRRPVTLFVPFRGA